MNRPGPSERGQAARERLAHNPFYVLELRPECTRAEVERQGQKLLGMLELELSGGAFYTSPLGRHVRTPEQVRAAMAELRDPNRRLLHELWATLPTTQPEGSAGHDNPDNNPDNPDEPSPSAAADVRPYSALRALGFGPRGES